LRAKRGRTCCSRPAWRWAGTRGKTVFVQVGKVKPFSDVGGRHIAGCEARGAVLAVAMDRLNR